MFRITKKGKYKEIAVAAKDDDGKVLFSQINEKNVSYKKAEAKVDSCKKNAKLLETPYKITEKNIKKYVK